jgi:hypothetical protein
MEMKQVSLLNYKLKKEEIPIEGPIKIAKKAVESLWEEDQKSCNVWRESWKKVEKEPSIDADKYNAILDSTYNMVFFSQGKLDSA